MAINERHKNAGTNPGAEPAEAVGGCTREEIDVLNAHAFEIRNSDTNQAILLSQKAHALSTALNYPDGIATAFNNEAFCYIQLTDYDLALERLFAALQIFETQKNELGVAQVQYNLCVLYFRFGDYSNALDGINKAIRYYQKQNNSTELARCQFQMGLLYSHLNDQPSAIDAHNSAIAYAKTAGLATVEAAAKMGLGMAYMNLKDYSRSNEFLQESLAIRSDINDRRGYAASLNAYMNLCIATENYGEIEAVSAKGVSMAIELGDKMALARFNLDLAKTYFVRKDLTSALQKALEVLEVAGRINLKMAIAPAQRLLSDIYREQGNYKEALHHFQVYAKVVAEVNDMNTAMKARSMQFLNKIEHAQKEAEINRLRNVELKNAVEQIEEKNREITDSIKYALRIQNAILPSRKMVKQLLPDSFILYKPKDIVAGDFYWMESAGDVVLFAACDCTGHGVPGAMVSVVCHNALNRAVKEFGLTDPALVLDKTAEIVRSNFSMSEEDIKDGMDISLFAYHQKDRSLKWSGANNPLWLIQNGLLLETKANKQPIGAHDNYTGFTTHSFNIESGDTLYLFTDGYADQFGGQTGQKKLTKKRFRDLLVSVQDKDMAEQQKFLDDFHNDYRNEAEQVDDILVMGVRF